jgi:hypothetical protein
LKDSLSREELELVEKLQIRQAADKLASLNWGKDYPKNFLTPFIYNAQTGSDLARVGRFPYDP